MKVFKILFLFLISFSFVLTSCEKDNVDEIIKEEIIKTPKVENKIIQRLSMNQTGGLDLGCFSIDYPFTMITVNGTLVEITSDSDLETAFLDSLDYIIDFVYPLEITYSDGETSTIANVEELSAAFATCVPDDGWGSAGFPAFLIGQGEYCFDLVYPLNLMDLDENLITVIDENAFIDALAGNEILFFVFPLQLMNSDGEVITVVDDQSLFDALLSCDNIGGPCDSTAWGGNFACYEFQFPVSFEMIDGTIAVANDLNELNVLFLNGQILNFNYPLSLIQVETSEVVIVNNDDELLIALEACGIVVVTQIMPAYLLIEGNGNCYDILYPLTTIDGTTINNFLELEANPDAVILMPITLVVTDPISGVTIMHQILDLDEYFEMFPNC